MEFQEFWKEKSRMCKNSKCKNGECWLYDAKGIGSSCDEYVGAFPEKAEQIVSQWSQANPVVTNGDKFREVFGFDIAMASVLLNEEWLNQEYKETVENS